MPFTSRGGESMTDLRVHGMVGKSTVRFMADAVIRLSGAEGLPAALVLLDSDGGALQALSASGGTTPVIANGDAISTSLLPASAISFGLGGASTLSASDLEATVDGTAFTLNSGGQKYPVKLCLLGEHQVMNALAALGIAQAAGIAQNIAIEALEGITTLGPGRMQKMIASDEVVIINDAISAHPLSVVAALKTLVQVAGSRRSVAVLGELTLGGGDAEDVRAAHDRIGRLVVRLNVKKLIVVGQEARHIHNAAGLEGSWDGESVLVDSSAEAYDLLRDELRPHDVVLVKSAERSSLNALAERLGGGGA